jgi:hypothetical protein
MKNYLIESGELEISLFANSPEEAAENAICRCSPLLKLGLLTKVNLTKGLDKNLPIFLNTKQILKAGKLSCVMI